MVNKLSILYYLYTTIFIVLAYKSFKLIKMEEIFSQDIYFQKWTVCKHYIKLLRRYIKELETEDKVRIQKALSEFKIELGIVISERDEALDRVKELEGILEALSTATPKEIRKFKRNNIIEDCENTIQFLTKELKRFKVENEKLTSKLINTHIKQV